MNIRVKIKVIYIFFLWIKARVINKIVKIKFKIRLHDNYDGLIMRYYG